MISFLDKNKITALGTKFAAVYATLVLGYVEEELLYPKIAEIYNTEFKVYIMNYRKHFLDDVFIIWHKSKNSLKCGLCKHLIERNTYYFKNSREF
jgi:hypothetical protein